MIKKLFYLFLLLPTFLIAQQVELYQQFNGKYDFTAFGNTLNASANPSGNCVTLHQCSTDLVLTPAQSIII